MAETPDQPSRSTRRRERPVEPQDEAAVNSLLELGLTRSEARAYVRLVHEAPLTAAEVALRAHIARPKVYEALHLLRERGFCVEIEAEPTAMYRAVPPQEALEKWLRQRDYERSVAADRDARVAEELVAQLPVGADGEVYESSVFEVVTGGAKVSLAFETMFSSARKSVDNMTQGPFIQPKDRWNVAEREAIERGVQVRALFSADSVGDPRRWKPLVEAGGAARVADRLPMKLLVRDGEEAMVSLRDPSTGQVSPTSVYIRNPDLVRPLVAMFEQSWAAARDLADGA
jgi:HTH-type transcriptional regulator, sugar sensing transcriptional regulator